MHKNVYNLNYHAASIKTWFFITLGIGNYIPTCLGLLTTCYKRVHHLDNVSVHVVKGLFN